MSRETGGSWMPPVLVILAVISSLVVGILVGLAADTDEDWAAVEAVATAIASIFVAFGVVIGVRELAISANSAREQTRQSELQTQALQLQVSAAEEQARTVESQHILDVMRKWDDEDLAAARLAARRLIGSDVAPRIQELQDSGEREYFRLMNLIGFFEDLGFLVLRQKAVSLESVRELLRSSVLHYWDTFKPYIDMRRGQQETAYEWYERLVAALKEN